mmetsp:Transcript_18593/g.43337  ORF Transcript_18593/g.43337 Transcript_18593/m.43337 type:complete len:286 (-) Transcript_18593:49-906(-)
MMRLVTTLALMGVAATTPTLAFTLPTTTTTKATTISHHRPTQQQQQLRPTTTTVLNLVDPATLVDAATTTITNSVLLSAAAVPETGGVGYSQASYYTILGLYVMSFPGIWSQVKRSTAAKVKRKTYVSDGENAAGGKGLRQQAGEIMAYMKANNYEVVDAGETITFRGVVQRSASQAFFLVFCTALGLLSLGLVLDIQFHDLVLPLLGKPNWFLLALLSPYAGIYYWQSGDRVDDCSVKLSTNEGETENEITVQGSEEELERMWRQLEWKEKGMVKIPGLLEQRS